MYTTFAIKRNKTSEVGITDRQTTNAKEAGGAAGIGNAFVDAMPVSSNKDRDNENDMVVEFNLSLCNY